MYRLHAGTTDAHLAKHRSRLDKKQQQEEEHEQGLHHFCAPLLAVKVSGPSRARRHFGFTFTGSRLLRLLRALRVLRAWCPAPQVFKFTGCYTIEGETHPPSRLPSPSTPLRPSSVLSPLEPRVTTAR